MDVMVHDHVHDCGCKVRDWGDGKGFVATDHCLDHGAEWERRPMPAMGFLFMARKHCVSGADVWVFEQFENYDGEPAYQRRGASGHPDMVPGLHDAETAFTMHVRWDGCADTRDDGYLHTCSGRDVSRWARARELAYALGCKHGLTLEAPPAEIDWQAEDERR